MLKKVGVSLLALVLLATLIIVYNYSRDRGDLTAQLNANSLVAETALGPIEYSIIGDSGPFILWLHGTPGGHDQSLPVDGYRVLAPSRPGYLRTPLEVGSSPTEQADAYFALLDTLGVETVIVLGVSGGGPSAISFAARHPRRTRALITLVAVSQSWTPLETPAFFESDIMLWSVLSLTNRFMGPEGLAGMMISPQNQQRILDDPDRIDRMKDLMWSIWPMSLRLQGMQNDIGQYQQLDLPAADIDVPTLIVHGTGDINVPFSHSEALAASIPGAIFHVIEGGDHYIQLTHDEEVNYVVDTFLGSL